jgi:DNA-binding NarL/FixJ family response regulator
VSVTILIADDFSAWRSKTRELVDHSAQIVGEACDGVEAFEKAAQLRPDIVILDLGMPRLNGLDAAKLIRQTSPSTAIVFLSENTDSSIQQAALSIGHAFVLKRDAPKKLLPAIEAAQAAAAADEESDLLSSPS